MASKRRNPADLGAGILMISVSLVALVLGRDLSHGTALDMGPGYFPRYVAGLLMLIGIALVFKGFGSVGALPFKPRLRPLLAIMTAIAFFALAIRELGLPLTAMGSVAAASLAARGAKPSTVAAVAIGMSVFVCLVFIYGLGLTIPLWPRFWSWHS